MKGKRVNYKALFKVLQKAMYEESSKKYLGFVKGIHRDYPCKIKGCPNKAYAKKLCNAHYIRKRLGKPMDRPFRCIIKDADRTCSCGRMRGNTAGWYLCSYCYNIRRKEIIKSILIEALGGACQKCLKVYRSCVYDFHHIGRKKKDLNISKMMCNASLERIAKEAAKCILLCANCHREETFG